MSGTLIPSGAQGGNPSRSKYDVAVSCSHNDEPIAGRLASKLREQGLAVFFWRDEGTQLWGTHLLESISSVFLDHSKAVVILLSESYLSSQRCLLELEALASHEVSSRDPEPLLLPLRLDSYPVPMALAHLTWLSLEDRTEDDVAKTVQTRLALFEDDIRSSIGGLDTPELLRRISADRDHRAFEVLYERILPTILRQAKSTGNTDGEVLTTLVSDVMLNLWRNTPPPPVAADHFDGYIRYLVNKCLRHAVHERRRFQTHPSRTPKGLYATADADSDADRPRLKTAIQHLPEMDRDIIIKYYYEDQSINQIAAAMNASETAIRARLHRILANLKSATFAAEAKITSRSENR